MPPVVAEILVILSLILLNGFFSMSEMAVVSSRKSRLRQFSDEGRRGFRLALRIAEAPGQFLSTIQTGITLIGILNGVFGGATIAETFIEFLRGIPPIAPYASVLGFGLIVLVITFVTIVLGELVPKRLALSNPEAIASVVVFPVRFLSMIFLPIVKLLTFTTEVILKALRIKKDDEPPVSEDEIAALMEQGRSYGLFHEREMEMVERVLELKKKKPSAFMVPRRDVAFFDLSNDDSSLIAFVLETDLDYVPVCRGNLDDIAGVIDVRKALRLVASGRKAEIRTAIEEPLYVPQSMNALSVLEKFRSSRVSCAFIMDEYGGVLGMADLDDALGEIVGSVSPDDDVPSAVRRHDGSWFVDGLMPFGEFVDRFGFEAPESGGDYHTVAGFVVSRMDRIPQPGDSCACSGHEFEVADMDGNRIDKLIVKKVGEPLPDGE